MNRLVTVQLTAMLGATLALCAQRNPERATTTVKVKDGLTYVRIPAGTFVMGCAAEEAECYGNEKPAHPVTITRAFWIGQTEVSQSAYTRVTGQHPSRFTGSALPVESVSCEESQAYCRSTGGRLPTEAEWEYAARAGSVELRQALNRVAWFSDNSGARSHEVGQKEPNAWKLYDMLGNVWEWVADYWSVPYTSNSATDPLGPPNGDRRVHRGGAWGVAPGGIRATVRGSADPDVGSDVIGFRCAMDSEP